LDDAGPLSIDELNKSSEQMPFSISRNRASMLSPTRQGIDTVKFRSTASAAKTSRSIVDALLIDDEKKDVFDRLYQSSIKNVKKSLKDTQFEQN
jgi:hypothetical protein